MNAGLYGVVRSPLGVSFPTVMMWVDSDSADEAAEALQMAAALAQEGTLPLHDQVPPPSSGVPHAVRLYGCMPCGERFLVAAPRDALLAEEYACPRCGPGAAVAISDLLDPTPIPSTV